MEKNSVPQIILLSVIIITALAFISGGATIADAYSFLVTLAGVIILVAAISLGGQTSTELIKVLLKWIGGWGAWTKFITPNKYGSWLIAGLVAWGGVHGFDLDFFKSFDAFNNVDPHLLEVLTSLLVWGGSALWHLLLPVGVLKAPAKA